MAEYPAYEALQQQGIAPSEVYRVATGAGMSDIDAIRMLRTVFGLTLAEAKEAMVVGSGTAVSLEAHESALADELRGHGLNRFQWRGYPAAVAAAPGRQRRDWVIRTTSVAPDDMALRALGARIEADLFEVLRATYGDVTDHVRLESVRPTIAFIRLDDLHLVACIEFADLDHTIGDASAIAEWGTLQRIHQHVEIDDLEGLPSSYWFFLRPPPA